MAFGVDIHMRVIAPGIDSLLIVIKSTELKRKLAFVWGMMYSTWTRNRFELYSKTGGVSWQQGLKEREMAISREDPLSGAPTRWLFEEAQGAQKVAGFAAAGLIEGVVNAKRVIEDVAFAVTHPTHPMSTRNYGTSGNKWPPLAASTLEGRRRKGKDASILRDTGMLFAALNHIKAIPYTSDMSMRCVFVLDAPGRYPRGNANIADVASFHQKGGPNLPQRVILQQLQQGPPIQSQTKGGMAAAAAFSNLAGALNVTDQGGSADMFAGKDLLADATGYNLWYAMLQVGREIYIESLRTAIYHGFDIATASENARPQNVSGDDTMYSKMQELVSAANWGSSTSLLN